MVRITSDKIIIEIPHVAPEDALKGIQEGIIFGLQNQDRETLEAEKLHDAYYFLLLLLRETMSE